MEGLEKVKEFSEENFELKDYFKKINLFAKNCQNSKNRSILKTTYLKTLLIVKVRIK